MATHSYSSLLPLLEGISLGSTAQQQSLSVPSHLYVFQKYYYDHFHYDYNEEYSFTDKVLLFDHKNPIDKKKIKDILFEDLKYTGNRDLKGKSYDSSHAIDGFVDWSKNYRGMDTLSDVLQIDLNPSAGAFTPIAKDIRINRNFLHSSVVPLYGFYFNGSSDHNEYQKISFGKRKINSNNLKYYQSYANNLSDCSSGWVTPYLHGADADSEGYEGQCSNISMGGSSPFTNGNRTLWTTPYVSYKYAKRGGWDDQYYYSVLGGYSNSEGSGSNLVKGSSSYDSWFLNYDDVFKVDVSDDQMFVSLNENSSVVKGLSTDNPSSDNRKMMDFLKASSMVEFSISFRQAGNKYHQFFNIKDVLENRAKVDISSSNQIFSDFVLSVKAKPNTPAILANTNPNYQRFYYQLNLDSLKNSKKLFDKLVFDRNGIEDMFPSELLNPNKLAAKFVLQSNSGNKSMSVDTDFLKYLKVSGEVDDENGEAHLNYTFNDQVHRIDISNMQTLPDLSGDKIMADSIPEALAQLKARRTDITSQYFWENLVATEKTNGHDFSTTSQIHLSSKHPVRHQRIRSTKRWNFYGYDIRVKKPLEYHLLPKRNMPSRYRNISDLFDLGDYAKSLNLTKSDYKFHVLEDNGEQIQVLVRLNNSSPESGNYRLEAGSKPTFQRVYTLDMSHIRKDDKSNSSNPLALSSSENIVMMGSSAVFVTAAVALIAKKFGLLKLGWLRRFSSSGPQ